MLFVERTSCLSIMDFKTWFRDVLQLNCMPQHQIIRDKILSEEDKSGGDMTKRAKLMSLSTEDDFKRLIACKNWQGRV